MSIKISSTKNASISGIKAVLYGASGSGKTFMSSTLPGKTLILSAEAGLMSLREHDIDAVTITSIDDLKEAYTFVNSDAGNVYDNLVLDSLSEIAEQVLEYEKTQVKDGRLAYGALAEQVVKLTKAFRDMQGKNVILIAKLERQKDEFSGAMLYMPSFPGSKLANNIQYLVDEVFALRTDRDNEGNLVRYIQCQRCNQYDAKDRSGTLNQYEPADFTAIFNKINGTASVETTATKKGGK